MKIGFIGLGKLGLPVALAIEAKGHEVVAWDISEVVRSNIEARVLPYKEIGVQELLDKTKIKLSNDFDGCDLVFMAIQTPHEGRFEGTTRLTGERADFDYSFLKYAVSNFCATQCTPTNLVLISTVLPGTMEREIKPLLSPIINFVYNPFFIAMGTVIPDFLHPEFVLIGNDKPENSATLKDFYRTIHSQRVIEMPIKDAELTKVAYNTFIGMKIVFSNTLMEICHKIGGNVDNVIGALKKADKRLISTKYLDAGMGDGGGCHPRDNIAMSYIANKLMLSHNFFDDLMIAREDQTVFLAYLITEAKIKYNSLSVVILGRAFKPETNIETGSPAILLANILDDMLGEINNGGFHHIETYVEGDTFDNQESAIFFIGTKHSSYKKINFPKGSVVIDPFGYIPEQEGVEIIHVGRNK